MEGEAARAQITLSERGGARGRGGRHRHEEVSRQQRRQAENPKEKKNKQVSLAAVSLQRSHCTRVAVPASAPPSHHWQTLLLGRARAQPPSSIDPNHPTAVPSGGRTRPSQPPLPQPPCRPRRPNVPLPLPPRCTRRPSSGQSSTPALTTCSGPARSHTPAGSCESRLCSGPTVPDGCLRRCHGRRGYRPHCCSSGLRA